MLGSTTAKANPAATAASKAFPCCSNICLPAREANGWAAAIALLETALELVLEQAKKNTRLTKLILKRNFIFINNKKKRFVTSYKPFLKSCRKNLLVYRCFGKNSRIFCRCIFIGIQFIGRVRHTLWVRRIRSIYQNKRHRIIAVRFS